MVTKDKAAMGAFVVGGLLLFGIGLFLIGDRRMLFSRSAEFYTEFAQISALESGAKVRVGGMDAGEVLEIQVPPAPGAKFRVKFKIIEKMFPVIRSDSVASIQTDGLLGNKFLLIDLGTTGVAKPGSTLNGREPFEIGDLLGKIRDTVASIDATVSDVKGDVADATQNVAEAAKHVDQIIVAAQEPVKTFTASVNRISESVNRISDDASVLMARIRSGQGSIGKLINDDSLFNDISGSTKQIAQVTENLRQTSADVKDIVSRIKSGNLPEDVERIAKNLSESTERLRTLIASFQPAPGGGEGIAGDLKATMASTREAMSDLSENLEALKHSFFFRGFFKDRGFYDLGSLSPVEYQSKQFEKDVSKERIWVQQGELFAVTASGAEELSDPGKKKLDAAIANFLQYSKDRAIIVEGYSSRGTVDEQFLTSRDRAAKVRDYLVRKFALSPDYVGAMPMGAFGGHGESIALVLLKK